MKKSLLFSMLVALMSILGVSPVLADTGDSADDPMTLGSGTCSFTWAGTNIWFEAKVPAGRILVTSPSEGTVQADIYDCYDDIASESFTSKTFGTDNPFKYENDSEETATIYVKVKNVLNATDVNFESYFDYVTAPANTTWQTATVVGEGTLTIDELDKEHNAPLWYKVVVPANTKVTLQKNYPHTCLLYAGDENAEAGTYVGGLFMYGNTKATYTNDSADELNLYIQFYSTSGIPPYTMDISFEAATPEEGSAWNYPITMTEGANKIKTIGDGAKPVWYAVKVAGRKSVAFTNDYWPITVSFYEGDEAAKADAEPAGSNFNAADTKTFENKSTSETTVYMKVVYSLGFAQYAQVSVAFDDLGEAGPTADAVVGEYTGTYELTSMESAFPYFNGLTGSADDMVLVVEKSGDNTVNITTPAANVGGLDLNSLTIKDVNVDEDGNITGGTFEATEIITGAATANSITVTGKLDGTNADVTFVVDANAMGAATTATFHFATPAADPTADAVVADYVGTYALTELVSDNDFFNGRTASVDNKVLSVTKNTDTTVNISTPLTDFQGIAFYSLTVTDVTVDAEGNLSGGSFESAQMGPWGTANSIAVSGKLDGTNANVTFVVDANIMASASTATLNFTTDTATSLSSVVAKQTADATYNLNGVRVNDSYKGIVIKNGKKYLNK